MNSLIYGAPQDLKNIYQCQSWTTKLVNHWNISSFAVTQNIKMCGTHPIPMNWVGFAKVLVEAQVGHRSNVLRSQIPLGS